MEKWLLVKVVHEVEHGKGLWFDPHVGFIAYIALSKGSNERDPRLSNQISYQQSGINSAVFGKSFVVIH